MGLSASQARLISLEARMSDVEYEGQQINQQRLVLSNKMNEIQERVYNMDVPTPPSKQDFMYDVYTGKTRGGKPVKVTINGDGSLNVAQTKTGTIVTKGDMVNITEGSTSTVDGQQVSVPAGYKMESKTVADVFHKHEDEDFGRTFNVTVPALKRETAPCTDQTVLAALAGKGDGSAGDWKKPSGVQITCETEYVFENGSTTKTEDGKTITATKDNGGIPKYTNFKASGDLETGNMIEDSSDNYNLTVSENGISATSYSSLCNDLNNGNYHLKTGVYDLTSSNRTCMLNNKEYKLNDLPELAKNALTDVALGNLQKHYSKDPQGSNHNWTWSDIAVDTNTYQLKGDLKAYILVEDKSVGTAGSSDDQTTVNGKTPITIAQANTLYGSDPDSSWSKCLSGLKQTMGTYNSKEGKRDFDEDAWRVLVTKTDKGNYTFSFVKTEDVAKGGEIQEYVTQQGDYEEDPTTIKANDPNVEYDPDTGHITKIKIDGQEIIMMYGQECNENEYEKAHNKYLYMKSLYDQEQNDLNKQTSIYQRQDKQLELKLTRLDTERNSLNTEIEAVKKVIQDAAEDFKTFSG